MHGHAHVRNQDDNTYTVSISVVVIYVMAVSAVSGLQSGHTKRPGMSDCKCKRIQHEQP